MELHVPSKVAASLGLRSSKRAARREKRRTIDFARGTCPPPVVKTPRVDRLIEGAVGGSRAELIAACVGRADNETLVEAVNELVRLDRSDLAARVSVDGREVLAAEGPALKAVAGALCRAGELEAVLALASALFEEEEEEEASVTPHPARVFGPLACLLLRSGRDPRATIERWRRAETRCPGSPAADFNPTLVEARKARSLASLFAVLDVMEAAGARGDDRTFEIVAQAAVRSLDFVAGAVSLQTLPAHDLKEAVFIGRSNVGKSSLVNMLANRKSAAFVSKKPGKTQQFNYFAVNDFSLPNNRRRQSSGGKKKKNASSSPSWDPPGSFYLVDVPGLGYAEVPKAARREWADLLEAYLATRDQAALAFHLVDSRCGPMPVDRDIFAMVKRSLARREGPPLRYVLVLTKADKREAKKNAVPDAHDALRADLAEHLGDDLARDIPILVTSATTRRGRDAMWRHLKHAALPSLSERGS
ncbi:hypothetical protein CTAYLR_003233 [Chrysophaeum taylorii]|uniref:EngB-type G domain-containing protein n=1 Tax=Chrysophaeum taylorii TaxID=2483200 RepID=A0AAD7UAX4_9STRA|nr:hypothetical protein CTAYLR_003233 [Chrysophaeum taylorii]